MWLNDLIYRCSICVDSLMHRKARPKLQNIQHHQPPTKMEDTKKKRGHRHRHMFWGLACVCPPLSAPESFICTAWRALGQGAAERRGIALTTTSLPPHGSLSEADLRLSGHIIVFEMPVVDPIKQKSHLLSTSRRAT